MVCEKHAPKPNPKLQKLKPHEYIGKFVKKGFPTDLGGHGPQLEHMWVEVTHIEGDVLIGKLNNDPIACRDIRCGDEVKVRLEEIEQVFE